RPPYGRLPAVRQESRSIDDVAGSGAGLNGQRIFRFTPCQTKNGSASYTVTTAAGQNSFRSSTPRRSTASLLQVHLFPLDECSSKSSRNRSGGWHWLGKEPSRPATKCNTFHRNR